MRYFNSKLLVNILIFTLIYINNESNAHEIIEWQYYDVPKPSSKKLNPAELMTDITNDISYRLLDLHSHCNRNNFAFSPTALTSVLIALYEGASGKSSYELRSALKLPLNRDIIRIGYRDIHRRLRTYFFEHDNPLNGLSLNKENVTITQEYEAVLKFYGYDLGMDMVSSTPNSISPITPNPTTTEIPVKTVTNEITTTELPIIQTTTEIPIPQTTTEPPIPQTTTDLPIPQTTTEQPIPESKSEETTSIEPFTTDIISTSELPTQTEETTVESSTQVQRTTEYIRQLKPVKTTIVPEIIPEKLKSSRSKMMRGGIKFGEWGTMPASTKSFRNKRNFLSHGLPFSYGGTFVPSFQSQFIPPPNLVTRANIEDEIFLAFVAAEHPIHIVPDEFQLTALELDKSYIIPKETSKNQIINHIFYITPDETIQTTYKVYNSILLYKYLEGLRLSVLELELDTPEYSLLILLPDYGNNIESAIKSLRYAPSLRYLKQQLKPKWVEAIIPDFKLKGNMFLTDDVINMGIIDIFEPYRADFGPMSEESSIYVQHIQQSINVNIRTKPIDQIKRNILPGNRPIEISVNQPFIFFIVDKELDIALMAGRVLNPLNVRIQ